MDKLISQTVHTAVTELGDFTNPTSGAKNRFAVHSQNSGELLQTITFHNGPIDHGANGIFMEDLLECVIARLEGFQKGPYACTENAAALHHFKLGLQCLDGRTGRIQLSNKS